MFFGGMQVANRTIKMVKQAAKWRNSASLIILSKKSNQAMDETDFNVLLLSRSENSSFMPTATVFPGGVCDTADESPLWLKHFQKLGIKAEQIQSLILERDPDLQPQPGIFRNKQEDSLHREISLRITAVRETFEEMGIMLCRDRKSLSEKPNGFGTYFEEFDRKHWQHLVHNDASQFLNLCQKLDVVPDIWSLNEWSVWLTPANFRKRFETVFYLVTLNEPDEPKVILEKNEGTNFMWLSPKDALIANFAHDIFLAPPQFFEISRLLNFNQLNEMQKFARKRAKNGSILMFPVTYMCTDGMVSLFPGDSNYPSDPDASTDIRSIDMTLEEYRSKATKLHRAEENQQRIDIHNNFDPVDGQLNPVILKSIAKLEHL